MRVIYSVKFLPISFQYGQISVQRVDMMELIREVERILSKASEELERKIMHNGGRIISTSLSVSQLNVGPIVGLLIVLLAVVEDRERRS
ncbi:MAG: hypothetical protein GXO23_07095 [Crenarchaeota archaeon]|nr:hypothetical protein [Thermoproteota archaeon]